MAIKAASGKLLLAEAPGCWFQALSARHRFRELALDAATACAAGWVSANFPGWKPRLEPAKPGGGS